MKKVITNVFCVDIRTDEEKLRGSKEILDGVGAGGEAEAGVVFRTLAVLHLECEVIELNLSSPTTSVWAGREDYNHIENPSIPMDMSPSSFFRQFYKKNNCQKN